MPNFVNNVNFNKFEMQNVKAHNLASAPGTPAAGQLYYNTGDGNLYVWDGIGSAWVDLTVQGSVAPDATASVKGIVQLAGDLAGTGSAAAAPVITAGAIDGGKVSATLKPSGSAAAGTEALRALGTTASTALAGNTRLDQITAPTASVAFNSQKITGLADGTSNTDAASWGQVQNLVQGLDAKASVRVATTAAGTLATSFANGSVVDGITLATGDRILIKDQAAPAENGIYTVNASGAPTRATDVNTWTSLVSAFTWVEVGTTNGDSGWLSTVDAGGTLGTTAVTFTQFSGAGQITAGAGLTKTGNTIDVVGTANRITVAADSIDISTSYVGQATITTLGTITTGVWTGTSIAVLNGGTGATTAAAARSNLSAAGKFVGLIPGATAGTAQTITHNLNSQDVAVSCRRVSDNAIVLPDVIANAVNTVTVTFGAATASGDYSITVIG